MSRRFAVLMISLLLAGISSVEIFYQAQEKELEDKTRKINGIPEGESWWFSGTGSPEERIAYRSMDSDSAGLFLRDPELGFRLRPNIRNVRSVSRRGGFTIFDARQSIGRFGWRIGKEAPNAKYDVLFLGDSFTYGAGLGDENRSEEHTSEPSHT